MKLSILIPTLFARRELFSRLTTSLALQIPGLNLQALLRTADVEVLADGDNGERPIGAKRNALIKAAAGDYVCFIDDDDRVSDDYVAEMLAGIAKGVDVVSIQGVVTFAGEHPHRFIDQPHRPWGTVPDGTRHGTFLRGVQHLDAVRREIALAVPFPEISWNEDQQWSNAIEASGLVKTWHSVDHPIYFYECARPL